MSFWAIIQDGGRSGRTVTNDGTCSPPAVANMAVSVARLLRGDIAIPGPHSLTEEGSLDDACLAEVESMLSDYGQLHRPNRRQRHAETLRLAQGDGMSCIGEGCHPKRSAAQSKDLLDSHLNADGPAQDFVFPSYELAPGASFRVHTNEVHQEYRGFSFGSGQALWANNGECGH